MHSRRQERDACGLAPPPQGRLRMQLIFFCINTSMFEAFLIDVFAGNDLPCAR
jgi:hypothetical protein